MVILPGEVARECSAVQVIDPPFPVFRLPSAVWKPAHTDTYSVYRLWETRSRIGSATDAPLCASA